MALAAVAVDLDPSDAAAERLAALLSLPLCDEPPSAAEQAIFAAIEAEHRAGGQTYSTEEIQAELEQVRREQAA